MYSFIFQHDINSVYEKVVSAIHLNSKCLKRELGNDCYFGDVHIFDK